MVLFGSSRIALSCCCLLAASLGLQAQPADSTRVLKRVSVTGRLRQWKTTLFPQQRLDQEEINRMAHTNVADIIRYFPGTQVKDYGGIGGLKTVSVRSLGAHHTGVVYDGIPITDMQGGQIDLGKLFTGSLQSIALYNAQPDRLLQPARVFASASSIYLQSATELHAGWKAQLALRGGSAGFVNPSLLLAYSDNRHQVHNLQFEWQSATGNYPFKAYDTGGTVKRQNADIQQLRLEYNGCWRGKDSSLLRWKWNAYRSDRGLPGSVIFFNPISAQRLKNQDWFLQSAYEKNIAKRTRVLLSGKYNHLHTYYLDPNFLSSSGKLENRFTEQELYGSVAMEHRFNNWFTTSVSGDGFYNQLRRSGEFLTDTANPNRTGWLLNLAVKANGQRFTLQSNLLYQQITDHINATKTPAGFQRLTPTVMLSVQPFDSIPLQVRAFYKNIFRSPTFNDLYYTFVGNAQLKPEDIQQWNLGISWQPKTNRYWKQLLLQIDGYVNRVNNKIMAVPRQNLFQWSMMNVGRVHVTGIDASLAWESNWHRQAQWYARTAYAFQQALDRSDPQSPSYNQQLPYTPVHTGSGLLGYRFRHWFVHYQFMWSAYRYRAGDRVPDNFLPGWQTHDARIGYAFRSQHRFSHRFSLELSNIGNQSYEIIRYYPMPGFQFRLGYQLTFTSSP
jgi:hypothetical protein